jgi:hypothetical protein
MSEEQGCQMIRLRKPFRFVYRDVTRYVAGIDHRIFDYADASVIFFVSFKLARQKQMGASMKVDVGVHNTVLSFIFIIQEPPKTKKSPPFLTTDTATLRPAIITLHYITLHHVTLLERL